MKAIRILLNSAGVLLWLVMVPAATATQVVYDTAASDQDGNLRGETERDYLGSASAQSPQGVLVADLNGDGFGDLVAGAPKYSTEGRVYVVFGSEDMSGGLDAASAADFVVTGSKAEGSNISGALAAGDINADGIADLLIGAPDTDVGSEFNNGAVIVIYGSETLSGEIDLATASPDIWIKGNEGDGLGTVGGRGGRERRRDRGPHSRSPGRGSGSRRPRRTKPGRRGSRDLRRRGPCLPASTWPRPRRISRYRETTRTGTGVPSGTGWRWAT